MKVTQKSLKVGLPCSINPMSVCISKAISINMLKETSALLCLVKHDSIKIVSQFADGQTNNVFDSAFQKGKSCPCNNIDGPGGYCAGKWNELGPEIHDLLYVTSKKVQFT